MGDIHGLACALEGVLDEIRPRVEPGDTVVFLGDYIDRGPDSKGCIDQVVAFAADVPAPVVALLGNHEQWLLDTLRDYTVHSWLFGMEGYTTIASYSTAAAEALRRHARDAPIELYTGKMPLPYELFFDIMPSSHLEFLKGLKISHRTPEAFCSHAGCNPDAGPPDGQSERDLVWGTRAFLRSYAGPDFIVYGHYSNAVADSGGSWSPCRTPFSLGLDTSKHGIVSAAQLPEGTIFQSSGR